MKRFRINLKKLDTIEVSFVSEILEHIDTEQFMLCFKINGNSDFYPVSVAELIKSTKESGEYWPFTCEDCGQSQCNGIHQPVYIGHEYMDAGLVTWFVRRPLRHEYDKKHELLYPKGYDIYIFDRKDYIENIAAAVKEGKKLVEKSMYNVEIIGYGTNKEGFLMAEPAIWKPSQL